MISSYDGVFSLHIVIPEGASHSNSKYHEIIEEECVEEPHEDPDASECIFNRSVLIVLCFPVGLFDHETECVDPEDGKQHSHDDFDDWCKEYDRFGRDEFSGYFDEDDASFESVSETC